MKYEKAEVKIDDEHFVKDMMPVTIPKDFNGVKGKISMEDFVPIKKVGRGTFGQVLLVTHKEDGKLYALKSLRKTKIIKMLQVEHTMSERKYVSTTCLESSKEWSTRSSSPCASPFRRRTSCTW